MLIVFVAASVLPVVEVHRSYLGRLRRDAGQQVVPDTGSDDPHGLTGRRRVSTGGVDNTREHSSTTQARMTADQWRSRERSVATSSSSSRTS